MPLVTLAGAELAFGLHPLLDAANLAVEEGERIGLIGRISDLAGLLAAYGTTCP